MTQRLGGVLLVALLATACSKDKAAERSSTGPSTGPTTGTDPATGDAAEPSCDAVVARMMSFSPGSGDAEKKLLGTACGSMSLAMKSCILAATSRADYDACGQPGGSQKPRP